jgi:hypothetical protein
LGDMDMNDSNTDIKEYSFWDWTDHYMIVVRM